MTVTDSTPPHYSKDPSDSAFDVSSPVNEKNTPVDQYETPMDEEADRKADKALLWKIDRTLVPFMTLLFLMSFLDVSNPCPLPPASPTSGTLRSSVSVFAAVNIPTSANAWLISIYSLPISPRLAYQHRLAFPSSDTGWEVGAQ